jgi:hypothetical protein
VELLRSRLFTITLVALAFLGTPVSSLQAAPPKPTVYVILWFDTEDYLLPASDDAALRVADFLTAQGIRGTFKVVGEKARTLERRKRTDVIAALKKHEIGFHANYHSVHPTPAEYLATLGWDEGVAEFDRREGPGRADVERIFGVAPTCYGQPGSSWGSQSYGAMRKWGMPVYLDAGRHVDLNAGPCYYAGILNLYRLEHTIRADLKDAKLLDKAKERFVEARTKLLAQGGGVVSTVYHPCEFAHKKFWDGVNFEKGANPPRDEWKAPPAMTPDESKAAFAIFTEYVTFMKRFPDVRFITASEAAKLYADAAIGKAFTTKEITDIAKGAFSDEIGFQTRDGYTLSAAEVLAILSDFVAPRDGKLTASAALRQSPLGPTSTVPVLTESITIDTNQFLRTTGDVADFVKRQGRIPSTVWLGSTGVPPTAYLRTLAGVTVDLIDGKKLPEKLEIKPVQLTAERYVAEDNPKLWTWVIFPAGFKAPQLMAEAKKQAWTLKPALLTGELGR